MNRKRMNWQTITELHDLQVDLPRFTAAVVDFSRMLALDMTALEADHIALRCRMVETAQRWATGLARCGVLLSQSMIKGRPVCLFRLHTPLQVAHWRIAVVELPWPGEKQYDHDGWEHVEIVLPGAAQTLVQRARALLSESALRQPHIRVKSSLPVGDADKLANPTLAVSNGVVTIKFHPFSLEQVIGVTEN